MWDSQTKSISYIKPRIHFLVEGSKKMTRKKKVKAKDKARERVWKIRDSIQKLEDVKDKIIEFLNSTDESIDEAWITDVKEVYFSIVSAWELLKGISDDRTHYDKSAWNYLELAKSRLGQASSELRILGEDGIKLESELRDTFEVCWEQISTELENLVGKEELKAPTQRVIKYSEEEYHLPCSVCGEIEAGFKIGVSGRDGKKHLFYIGLTTSASFSLKDAKKVFSLLEEDKITEVHDFTHSSVVLEEGMDAYCPKCDKIYCSIHYNLQEEWDEGFYDCTYGTCPLGHKRIIND